MHGPVPLLTLLLLAVALAGCHDPSPDSPGATPTDGTTPPATDPGNPILFTGSFEAGLEGWTKGSDVPDDPNDPGNKVSWNITASEERAHEGTMGVNLTIDGRQDDGTIWVSREVSVEPGARYRANVSTWAWSASESFNTLAHLVLYLGSDEPTGEATFARPGDSGAIDDGSGGLREPLNRAEGWEEYSFEWETAAEQDGTLHVAVGISAVWETEMTYFVDDVRVTLDPVQE